MIYKIIICSINDIYQFIIYTDALLHIYKIYPPYYLIIKWDIIKIFLVLNKSYIQLPT